jgi:hypothetical protein
MKLMANLDSGLDGFLTEALIHYSPPLLVIVFFSRITLPLENKY